MRNIQLLNLYIAADTRKDAKSAVALINAALLSGDERYGEGDACFACGTLSASERATVRGRSLLLSGGDSVCSYVQRVAYAQEAGAVSVLFISDGNDPTLIAPSEYARGGMNRRTTRGIRMRSTC